MDGAYATEDAQGPLLWRRKDRPEINHQHGFAEVIQRLDVDELVAEYEHDKAVSPVRAHSGKRYFIDTHLGVPSSGPSSTRIEEHLALGLFRLWSNSGRLAGRDGRRLRFV